MANKEHENHFYFVSNAQLFSSSEHTEVLPMSIMAVNIAAVFHIFISIIGHTGVVTKQLQFLLMTTDTTNSDTSMIYC